MNYRTALGVDPVPTPGEDEHVKHTIGDAGLPGAPRSEAQSARATAGWCLCLFQNPVGN